MKVKGLKMKKGIKKTKSGNYIVDIDTYRGRDRYYTGDIAGRQLILTAKQYASDIEAYLDSAYNDIYASALDVKLAREDDGYHPYRVYRKGYIVG